MTAAEERVFALAYEREGAAQMGEPCPSSTGDPVADEDWLQSRIACVRAGLDALARMGQEWDNS